MTVSGYSFLDGLAKSNSGFAIVTMKPFDERTEPRPARARGDRSGQRPGRGDPRGAGLRLQPAADHRPRHRLGLRVPAARPRGPRPGRPRRGRRRADRRGGPEPAARADLHHLFGGDAAALPRPRPRAAADARRLGQRPLRHAAGHARLDLRQRLQPLRPHLAGADAGAPRPTARAVADIERIHVRSATGEMVPIGVGGARRVRRSARSRSSASTTTAR